MPAISQEKYFAQVGYKPHDVQKLYHQSKARFNIPICGRRTGKSVMVGRKYGHKLMQDNQRIWIVGPTYDLGEREFRVIWNDIIVGMKLGRDKRVKKAYNIKQGNMYIEMPWQSRLEVRSADKPDSLVGDGLDAACMSEAAKHNLETWEKYIRPALTDRRGIADFPSTPEGQNWLYKLYQMGLNGTDLEYKSFCFPSWSNPYVYPGGINDPEIVKLREITDPDIFAQEYGAEFTKFKGKIYADFTPETHVKAFNFNPLWKNYITFDFGYVNPFAAIEFQVDPWDNIWIWREHYKSRMTNEQHVRALIARDQPAGYHLDCAFGDAADPEACDYISQHLIGCLHDPLSKSNWKEGVDLVNDFVRIQVVGMDDDTGELLEEPKLFVHPRCTETINEFMNYKAPGETRGRNPQAPREVGLKIGDHAMDAIRYALMHLFKLGLYEPIDVANPHLMGNQVSSSLLAVMERVEDLPLYVADFFSGSDETFVNLGMDF